MRITAFTDAESGEPITVDHDLDTGLDDGDDEPRQLGELLDDIGLSIQDIDVCSFNVATIATHALHGVLKALAEEMPRGKRYAIDQAKAWATAALRELAFYDVDGIEVNDHITPGGHVVPRDGILTRGDMPIASDPGRENVPISCSPNASFGTPLVDWPDA